MKETSMIKAVTSMPTWNCHFMEVNYSQCVGLYENTSDCIRNQLNYVETYKWLILNVLLLKVSLSVLQVVSFYSGVGYQIDYIWVNFLLKFYESRTLNSFLLFLGVCFKNVLCSFYFVCFFSFYHYKNDISSWNKVQISKIR